jgi:hypothetical protein
MLGHFTKIIMTQDCNAKEPNLLLSQQASLPLLLLDMGFWWHWLACPQHNTWASGMVLALCTQVGMSFTMCLLRLKTKVLIWCLPQSWGSQESSQKNISKCCFLILSVLCPLLCAAYTLSSVTSYFGNRKNLWSAEYFAFKWKNFWPAIGKWTCLYPLGYQSRINPILLLVPSTHWSSPYTWILRWRTVCTQICPKTQGGWSEFCETFDCTILHLVSTSDIYSSGQSH